MMNAHEERQGFALASAVLALVVVGAIVTGGFYAASQEHEVSTSTRHGMNAFYIAENGLQTVLGTWDKDRYEAIEPGTTYDTTIVLEDAGASDNREAIADIRIHRFDDDNGDHFFFVGSDGRIEIAGEPVARRRTGTVVRLMNIPIDQRAAVAARGDVVLKGHAKIHGEDTTPSGWGDCPTPHDKPGVVIPPGFDVDTAGKNTTVTGDPPIVEDEVLEDSTTLVTYGDYTYEDLAEMADYTFHIGDEKDVQNQIGPNVQDGKCVITDSLNWGDPDHAGGACDDHYPIIHVEGSRTSTFKISGGGEGQGILLVDGNLAITGSFHFNGIVIVRGKLTIKGTGGDSKLNGVVLVNSGVIDKNQNSTESKGDVVVRYSSCVVENVLDGTTAAEPIDKRSWMDLSAAMTS